MHLSPSIRAGDLLFVSGQVALDPTASEVLAPDAEGQARICLDRVRAIVEEAGGTMGDVVRVECFLTDREHFAAWDAAFREAFPLTPPARTTVICGLALDGLLVEVQATAALAEAQRRP